MKLFLATGFELVSAIIALYFSTCSVPCGNGILFPFAIIPAYATYNGTNILNIKKSDGVICDATEDLYRNHQLGNYISILFVPENQGSLKIV